MKGHIMDTVSRHDEARNDSALAASGRACRVAAISAAAVAAAFALSGTLPAEPTIAKQASITPAPQPDPYELIVDALLVPALEGSGVPLRWVDPRVASRCGPHTSVRVNHETLTTGALVPRKPFELEWLSDG